MMDAIFDVSSFFNSEDRGVHIDGPYEAGFGIGMIIFYILADDTTVLMFDPAENAEMPLKFDWGHNLRRWKEQDRIAREIKEAELAARLEEEERLAAEEAADN